MLAQLGEDSFSLADIRGKGPKIDRLEQQFQILSAEIVVSAIDAIAAAQIENLLPLVCAQSGLLFFLQGHMASVEQPLGTDQHMEAAATSGALDHLHIVLQELDSLSGCHRSFFYQIREGREQINMGIRIIREEEQIAAYNVLLACSLAKRGAGQPAPPGVEVEEGVVALTF